MRDVKCVLGSESGDWTVADMRISKTIHVDSRLIFICSLNCIYTTTIDVCVTMVHHPAP